MEFLSDGGTFRSVRTVMDPFLPDPDNNLVVFKTLYSDGDYTHETLAMHALDASVMGVAATASLSSSNAYIAQAFASCGQAVMTEYCDEYKYTVIKNDRMGYLERLEAALQATRALDTLHYLGSSPNNHTTNQRTALPVR